MSFTTGWVYKKVTERLWVPNVPTLGTFVSVAVDTVPLGTHLYFALLTIWFYFVVREIDVFAHLHKARQCVLVFVRVHLMIRFR